MSKVLVAIQRLLQNKTFFQGKIVFTLEGDNSVLVTSFIPETGIFIKGRAYAYLVPNSLLEGRTWYHYAVYPSGHMPGVFLSEPVEEGNCLVPEEDCNLDDIILKELPDKDTAQEIIDNASSIMAELRSALAEAKECSFRACENAVKTREDRKEVSSLVQDANAANSQIKNRQEEINASMDSFEAMLQAFEINLKNQVQNMLLMKTQEALKLIADEQSLINDLWLKIHQMFGDIENLSGISDMIRDLHEEYIAGMNELRNQISSIAVPTKLSELENDILEPITNAEINSLY